jgi:hypothetical protein
VYRRDKEDPLRRSRFEHPAAVRETLLFVIAEKASGHARERDRHRFQHTQHGVSDGVAEGRFTLVVPERD